MSKVELKFTIESPDTFKSPLSGRIVVHNCAIEIFLDGYGTVCGENDSVIMLHQYTSGAELLVWPDINTEDPVFVPLSNAKNELWRDE